MPATPAQASLTPCAGNGQRVPAPRSDGGDVDALQPDNRLGHSGVIGGAIAQLPKVVDAPGQALALCKDSFV